VRVPSLVSALLLVVAAFVSSGCDDHTCANACAQYYGTGDGQCARPPVVTSTTNPSAAEAQCVRDCRAALYSTAAASGSDTDEGGYSRLENEQDALEFIDCIVDQDYSSAVFNDTCEDLFFECPWIKW